MHETDLMQKQLGLKFTTIVKEIELVYSEIVGIFPFHTPSLIV